MEDQQLKASLEALLFISASPLSADRLRSVFEDVTKEQVEAQLHALRVDYDVRGAGIMLAEIAGGWQFATRTEHAALIRKFKSVKTSTRLSRPALETLAIVAYKQPITRTEIEAIRGVNIGGIVRNLMERRLVKIVGKKDVPGKPMMYGTTIEFLQYFGLKDLSSLPTLREFTELEAGEETMLTEAAAGQAASDDASGGPPDEAGGDAEAVGTAAAPEAENAG